MRLQLGLPLLTLSLLSACAPALGSSDAARIKALAPKMTGTYDGPGRAGILKSSYRLLLNIDPRTGRADAVITNVSINKVYAASGTFVPFGEVGGSLELKVLDGKRSAGTFKARLMTDASGAVNLQGSLKAFLLTYQLELQKVDNPRPIPRFLPDTPPSSSQIKLPPVTTNSLPTPPTPDTSTSVPVYVTPTPGALPK